MGVIGRWLREQRRERARRNLIMVEAELRHMKQCGVVWAFYGHSLDAMRPELDRIDARIAELDAQRAKLLARLESH